MDVGTRIREDVEEGLGYVRYSDRLVTTVVVGTVLLHFSYFVVPGILFLGYLVYVVQYSVAGFYRTPRFHDWRAMLVDGSKAVALLVVYLISPVVLIMLFITAFLGIPTQGFLDVLGSVLRARISIEDVPQVVQLSIGLYVFPAAFVHFSVSRNQNVRDGFQLGRILSFLTSPRYLVAWTAASGFLLVGAVAVIVPNLELLFPGADAVGATPGAGAPDTNFLTITGAFLYNVMLLSGYAIFFLCQLAAYHIFGRAWIEEYPPSAYPDYNQYQETAEYRARIHRTWDEWSAWNGAGPSPRRYDRSGLVDYVGTRIRSFRTLVVGGFVVILADVVFPLVVLGGYLARLIRREGRTEGRTEPVAFTHWRGLLVDGTRFFTVWFVYILPPLYLVSVWWARFEDQIGLVTSTVLGTIFGGLAIRPLRLASTALHGMVFGNWFGGSVPTWSLLLPGLSVLWAFLAIYALPAALVACSHRSRLRSGFDLRVIASTVGDVSYARAWVRAFAVTLVGWVPIVALLLGVQRLNPLAGSAADVGSTVSVVDLLETTSSSSIISVGIVPFRIIGDPQLIPVHATLLLAGFVFFTSQVVCFSIVGPTVVRLLEGNPDSRSIRARPRDRPFAWWIRIGGLLGVVGGLVLLGTGIVGLLGQQLGVRGSLLHAVWVRTDQLLPVGILFLLCSVVSVHFRNRNRGGITTFFTLFTFAYSLHILLWTTVWLTWILPIEFRFGLVDPVSAEVFTGALLTQYWVLWVLLLCSSMFGYALMGSKELFTGGASVSALYGIYLALAVVFYYSPGHRDLAYRYIENGHLVAYVVSILALNALIYVYIFVRGRSRMENRISLGSVGLTLTMPIAMIIFHVPSGWAALYLFPMLLALAWIPVSYGIWRRTDLPDAIQA